MTQAESRRSREIIDSLTAEGHFAFKVHGSALMMAGLPDIICCARGLFIGIETKMPDKRDNTSARQDRVHEQIKLAGGKVHVATTVAEALDVVNSLLRELPRKNC